MTKVLEKRAKDAEDLIQYYENRGRVVTGVSFAGAKIHLDFAAPNEKDLSPADLVRMDQ
ncbi:hypothetical protein [Roseobacter sp. N2S]|uniref:hypothetical protein n=1 Tax=Roseobacter sp. N2S TaxID=2663844 RepID=UPI002863E672|nr:hypothetical protein [Roseobacter sp. N2S]MDR6264866.1 hypothetical protein [Roseobacter sp. N2S]